MSSSPITYDSEAPEPSAEASSSRDLVARASRALREERAEDARGLLEEAVTRAPSEARARNLLGLAYFKLGRIAEAARIYEDLTRRFPGEPSLFVNLGLVRLREGKLAEAVPALEAALQQAPGHRRAHCYLGLVLYRRGDLLGARRHFLAGDAHELARRVDRLSAAGVPAGGEGGLLREVSHAAEVALRADELPFRSVDPDEGSEAPRDDRDWEASVEHHQAVPTADPAEPSTICAGPQSQTRPSGARSNSDFQLASATAELAALAEAAEDVAPEPPELVFSLDPRGRSLLTREEVDALESGLGRAGFVAGPGGRAKLTLTGRGLLRADAFVLALGRRPRGFADAVPEAGVEASWWSVEGPSVLLLSVDGVAVALRNLRDAAFATGVLRGFEGRWRAEPGAAGEWTLRGQGTALIASPGVPLLVPLAPGRAVICARAALLGWSNRVSVVPSGSDEVEGTLDAKGPGWILVSERPSAGPMR